MGKRHEYTLLQRRHPDGQQTHEKNAQHHSSSGKYKSKPQSDTTSHLVEWLKLAIQKTTGVGKDAEKEDLFCTAGGNAN